MKNLAGKEDMDTKCQVNEAEKDVFRSFFNYNY